MRYKLLDPRSLLLALFVGVPAGLLLAPRKAPDPPRELLPGRYHLFAVYIEGPLQSQEQVRQLLAPLDATIPWLLPDEFYLSLYGKVPPARQYDICVRSRDSWEVVQQDIAHRPGVREVRGPRRRTVDAFPWPAPPVVAPGDVPPWFHGPFKDQGRSR